MLSIERDNRDRKAAQLRAVMQVSRKINTTLDLEQLLIETVDLIKKTFDFLHLGFLPYNWNINPTFN